jgi:hypothetical protein
LLAAEVVELDTLVVAVLAKMDSLVEAEVLVVFFT